MKIIEEIIYPAIDVVKEEQEIDVENSPELQLFGKNAVFDSLSLVNLIVTIEENISDKLNVDLTLANENAMSRSKSPFKTVQSLADYIQELVDEVNNG